MFKSILRYRFIRLKNYVRRFSVTTASNSISQEAENVNLKEQLNDANNKLVRNSGILMQSNSNLDLLINKIRNCNDLSELFDLIKPHLTELRSNHIEIVNDKLCEFFSHEYLGRKPSFENSKILKTSPIFKSYLEVMNQHVKQLSNKSLVQLIRIFRLEYTASYNLTFKNTIDEIKLRSMNNDFSLNEILDYLRAINYYITYCSLKPHNLVQFNEDFIRIAENKILNDELDVNDTAFVQNAYSVFTRPIFLLQPAHETVINYLVKKLLNSDYQIEFKQSIRFLNHISHNYFLFKIYLVSLKTKIELDSGRPTQNELYFNEITSIYEALRLRQKEKRLYPSILNDLIKKCNDVIYEKFKSNLNNEDLSFYINKMHSIVSDANGEFSTLYDERLLNYLTPYVYKNVKFVKQFHKYYIIRMNLNYASFNIYDTKLIQAANDCFNSESYLRKSVKNEEIAKFYSLLSKFRLPYVNHQNSVGIMLNEFQDSNFKFDALQFLSELVLNDANNINLLNYLIEKIDNGFYEYAISIDQFKRVALAKGYLTMFANYSIKTLKVRIKMILDKSIENYYLLSINPKGKFLNSKYIRIDNRLQMNGYLSNGAYIDKFVIYNKEKQDLISLIQSINSFDKIDQIQLSENQEL